MRIATLRTYVLILSRPKKELKSNSSSDTIESKPDRQYNCSKRFLFGATATFE